MIHLKYKCKVNFVKLPLIWTDLCLKLGFENVTAGRNTGCRSVVNCASCSCSFRWLIQMRSAAFINHQPPAGSISAVHMRECTGIKKFPWLRNRSKTDPCSYERFCLESLILSFPKVVQIPPESPCIYIYVCVCVCVLNSIQFNSVGIY